MNDRNIQNLKILIKSTLKLFALNSKIVCLSVSQSAIIFTHEGLNFTLITAYLIMLVISMHYTSPQFQLRIPVISMYSNALEFVTRHLIGLRHKFATVNPAVYWRK